MLDDILAFCDIGVVYKTNKPHNLKHFAGKETYINKDEKLFVLHAFYVKPYLFT
jgi:hypothetical protein